MFSSISTQIQCYFMHLAYVPIEQKQCNHCREIFGGRVRRQVKHKQNENAASRWDQVIQLTVERERERAEKSLTLQQYTQFQKGGTHDLVFVLHLTMSQM